MCNLSTFSRFIFPKLPELLWRVPCDYKDVSRGLRTWCGPHPARQSPCSPASSAAWPSGSAALVWGAQGRRVRYTCMRQPGEQYRTGVIHPLYITAKRGCGRGRRVSISNVEKKWRSNSANMPGGRGRRETGGRGRSLTDRESAWKET